MIVDRYTKIILTVIAVALSAIAIQGVVGSANAGILDGQCGLSQQDPCYVAPSDIMGLRVIVMN